MRAPFHIPALKTTLRLNFKKISPASALWLPAEFNYAEPDEAPEILCNSKSCIENPPADQAALPCVWGLPCLPAQFKKVVNSSRNMREHTDDLNPESSSGFLHAEDLLSEFTSEHS